MTKHYDNSWAPPASQVHRVKPVRTLEQPKAPLVAPSIASARVLRPQIQTNLRMECQRGHVAGGEEGLLRDHDHNKVEASTRMASQSFWVAPEIATNGGIMELSDGLLYVQGNKILMTQETVRGMTFVGCVVMEAAQAYITAHRSTGALMSERERALKEQSLDQWWAVPVSKTMAPLSFGIFQAVVSGHGALAASPETYVLWMEGLGNLRQEIEVASMLLLGTERPGGRPLVKSTPMRASQEVKNRDELALYLETAKAVLDESSKDMRTVLMDGWPESWSTDSYRKQALESKIAAAVDNALTPPESAARTVLTNIVDVTRGGRLFRS